MGLLDHRKQWEFTVKASPDECVRAFLSVFDSTRKGGPLLARANWRIQRTGNGAEAVYQGRGGMAGAMTGFSRTASNIEGGAVGSTVSFKAQPTENGSTVCTMWLSSFTTTYIFFTNDARFIRSYMRRVQGSLAQIDPAVLVHTV